MRALESFTRLLPPRRPTRRATFAVVRRTDGLACRESRSPARGSSCTSARTTCARGRTEPAVRERAAVLNDVLPTVFPRTRKGPGQGHHATTRARPHPRARPHQRVVTRVRISELLTSRAALRLAEMAGLLVYTATSDSAGSLGGLIAQAEEGRLDAHARAGGGALRRGAPSDPLCIEADASGVDSLNLAACHACLLLPEVCVRGAQPAPRPWTPRGSPESRRGRLLRATVGVERRWLGCCPRRRRRRRESAGGAPHVSQDPRRALGRLGRDPLARDSRVTAPSRGPRSTSSSSVRTGSTASRSRADGSRAWTESGCSRTARTRRHASRKARSSRSGRPQRCSIRRSSSTCRALACPCGIRRRHPRRRLRRRGPGRGTQVVYDAQRPRETVRRLHGAACRRTGEAG